MAIANLFHSTTSTYLQLDIFTFDYKYKMKYTTEYITDLLQMLRKGYTRAYHSCYFTRVPALAVPNSFLFWLKRLVTNLQYTMLPTILTLRLDDIS